MSALDGARVLFIASAGVFFLLGFGTLLVDRGLGTTGSGPLRDRLAGIAKHANAWRWLGLVFSISFALVSSAVSLLALQLVRSGFGEAAMPAAVLFLLASGAGIASMAVASTGVVRQAQTVNATGVLTADAKAWWDLMEALISAFMVCCFAAMFLLGLDLLRAHMGPAWVAWFSMGLGGFLALTYPLKLVLSFWIADLPLWVFVWAALVGIGLSPGG
jgi:hypothetical protein